MKPFLLLPIFIVVDVLVVLLVGAASGNAILSLTLGAAAAIFTLSLYARCTVWIANRRVDDLPVRRRFRVLARGTLAGIGLFTATVLLIALTGGFSIDGWGSAAGMLSILGLMTAVATAEEVLFRGILFRLVEERTGTWIAMAVSAALFGILHLVNDPSAIGGELAIMVAGAMTAAAYVATRALWLPIGLHLGWNFAEGGLFGVTVSGADSSTPGLLRGVLDGPAVLTGGTFGPEASIFAVLISLAATLHLLRLAHRRGNLRPRRATAPADAAPADAAPADAASAVAAPGVMPPVSER
ncbi:CAAX amino protease [Actinoplanes sp. OR16]|uniref:CPBP family intramembrane glutamic endopeptidase n=1 Tax=Actinoplanes sp. OR16 TaxID=946334 RepID=UPI000F6E91EE|nr:type II CAAX endopeptidase family protein [Actinoplanes sp. OR16]BBH70619.1 CAAX amino protease [Actinoplanes sp. OR16]